MPSEIPLANKNLFITIDGLSGSGKTTMATLLAAKLGGLYLKSPPHILDSIRSEVDKHMDPTARILYYLCGIVQQAKDIEKELVHRSVVLDKYVYTTLAYAWSTGIEASVPSFVQLLKPDFSFYMVAPDDIRLQRIQSRDTDISYRNPQMLDIEQRTQKEFFKFDLVKIENNDSINATLNHILQIIQGSENGSQRRYFDLNSINLKLK